MTPASDLAQALDTNTRERSWDGPSRTWHSAPPRRCLVCDVELPKREGRGGPRRYCDEHAPANRAKARAYYDEHRDELLEYQRRRNGSKRTIERECATPGCTRTFRTYSREKCGACRQRDYRLRIIEARQADANVSPENVGRGYGTEDEPRDDGAPLGGGEPSRRCEPPVTTNHVSGAVSESHDLRRTHR